MGDFLRFNDFIMRLKDAGWTPMHDGNLDGAKELWSEWFPLNEEIERLRNLWSSFEP